MTIILRIIDKNYIIFLLSIKLLTQITKFADNYGENPKFFWHRAWLIPCPASI
jgi:hypothetical protein